METISAVLGGCGGIGSRVADHLVRAGHHVFVLDLESNRRVAQAQISACEHSRLAFVPCDVTSPDSIRLAFAEIANAGRLDNFVNASGIIRRGAFLDMSRDDIRAVTDVNVVGAFQALQAAARLMVEGGGGRIVNIASVHALRTTPGRTAYAASKGAILALTRAMAVELAVHGILVNAVAPGPVAAGMQEGDGVAHTETDSRRLWTAATPVGRVAQGDEVARAVLFLVSETNSFINGETLVIDGGASVSIASAGDT